MDPSTGRIECSGNVNCPKARCECDEALAFGIIDNWDAYNLENELQVRPEYVTLKIMKFFRTDLTSIQPANHTRRTPITAEELEGHATMSATTFDDAAENILRKGSINTEAKQLETQPAVIKIDG